MAKHMEHMGMAIADAESFSEKDADSEEDTRHPLVEQYSDLAVAKTPLEGEDEPGIS